MEITERISIEYISNGILFKQVANNPDNNQNSPSTMLCFDGDALLVCDKWLLFYYHQQQQLHTQKSSFFQYLKNSSFNSLANSSLLLAV